MKTEMIEGIAGIRATTIRRMIKFLSEATILFRPLSLLPLLASLNIIFPSTTAAAEPCPETQVMVSLRAKDKEAFPFKVGEELKGKCIALDDEIGRAHV